jgi:hypothetical protein
VKHIVYRGKMRRVVVRHVEFPRDVPVPVKGDLAERLLRLPDFEDATPVAKQPKARKAPVVVKTPVVVETYAIVEDAPSEPIEIPTPEPVVTTELEISADVLDDPWPRY